MEEPEKLATLAPDGRWVRHRHPNLWQFERTGGPDRLALAPAAQHVELLLDLLRELPEPFGLLYILIVSRTGRAGARLQAPRPMTFAEVEAFVRDHAEYLENDARHHLWIGSRSAQSLVVYDNHDVLYAYGPLFRFESVAEEKGLQRGSVVIPAPHAHGYNPKFDATESALLARMDWIESPLAPGDGP